MTIGILSILLTAVFSILRLNTEIFYREERGASVRLEDRRIIRQLIDDIQQAFHVNIQVKSDETTMELTRGYQSGSPQNQTYKLKKNAGSTAYTLSVKDGTAQEITYTSIRIYPLAPGVDFFSYDGKNVGINMLYADTHSASSEEAQTITMQTKVTPRLDRGNLQNLKFWLSTTGEPGSWVENTDLFHLAGITNYTYRDNDDSPGTYKGGYMKVEATPMDSRDVVKVEIKSDDGLALLPATSSGSGVWTCNLSSTKVENQIVITVEGSETNPKDPAAPFRYLKEYELWIYTQ